jgi:hypothetical protein
VNTNMTFEGIASLEEENTTINGLYNISPL